MISEPPFGRSHAEIARIPSHQFPPTLVSVAAVRRMVHETLDGVGCNTGDAVLVASELAANAVLHAGTPYVVELRVDDAVRIEVTDSGPPAPFIRPAPRRLDGDGGWGLALVAELASRWGVEWLDGCKVVWAEVPREARS
jgi:anti-sigma regulatory factor (Ser/Thr protein kinase)